MAGPVAPHTTPVGLPCSGSAFLNGSSAVRSCENYSAAENPDVEKAVELLHEATRVVSNLGKSCRAPLRNGSLDTVVVYDHLEEVQQKAHQHFLYLRRLLSSCGFESGTCVDANGVYLVEAWNATKQQSDAGTNASRQQLESTAWEELQKLAEANLREIVKRVTETEAEVRSLKNKILLNSQAIDQLVAYRLLG